MIYAANERCRRATVERWKDCQRAWKEVKYSSTLHTYLIIGIREALPVEDALPIMQACAAPIEYELTNGVGTQAMV